MGLPDILESFHQDKNHLRRFQFVLVVLQVLASATLLTTMLHHHGYDIAEIGWFDCFLALAPLFVLYGFISKNKAGWIVASFYYSFLLAYSIASVIAAIGNNMASLFAIGLLRNSFVCLVSFGVCMLLRHKVVQSEFGIPKEWSWGSFALGICTAIAVIIEFW